MHSPRLQFDFTSFERLAFTFSGFIIDVTCIIPNAHPKCGRLHLFEENHEWLHKEVHFIQFLEMKAGFPMADIGDGHCKWREQYEKAWERGEKA